MDNRVLIGLLIAALVALALAGWAVGAVRRLARAGGPRLGRAHA